MNETIPLHRRTVDKLYDMQLQRDVAIVNGRTTAELGPLPLGGLPVVPKRRPDVKYDKLRANQTIDSEDDDMSIKKTISAAAVAVGLAACQPTAGKPPSQASTSAAPQAASAKDISAQDALPDAVAKNKAAQPIPEEIQEFVPGDSTLLAYKKFDLTGDGNEDAVIVIKHPVTEQHPDYANNPCDFIVLHGQPHGFKQVAKSSKVVDCTYKNFTRYKASSPDALNDYIEMQPFKIVYSNEKDMGGDSTYTFVFSEKKMEWHLSNISITYSQPGEEGVRIFTKEASYQKDFGWIAFDNFQPFDEKLLDVLQKNEIELK